MTKMCTYNVGKIWLLSFFNFFQCFSSFHRFTFGIWEMARLLI